MHSTIVVGRLGADPELVEVGEKKTSKASFRVASKDFSKKDKTTGEPHTEWFNIIAWGTLAKIASDRLKTGSLVSVQGRLQTRNWADKNDATKKHYITELHVTELAPLADLKARPEGTTEAAQEETPE